MTMKRQTPTRIARLVLASCLIPICLAIVGAPLLASSACKTAAVPVYLCFSFVCHQIPERSFSYHGHPWAVCHRCAGIYSGMLLAALLPQALLAAVGDPRRRRGWVWAASLPLLFDWAIPLTGVWHGSALTRFATGFLFGLMLTSLLVPALAELLAAASRRHACGGSADFQGVAT
jgi:uncharacterized membrane protein